MNARERMLLVALITVVSVGGVGALTYLWFVKPFWAYNKTIETLTDEKNLEQAKWDQFKSEHKKLELARLKSLPANPADAQSVYNFYLEKTLKASGLTMGGIQTAATATRVKPTGSIPSIKEVNHQVMTFTVTARGELSDLVKLMELLQATPYEHRIRTLGVDRADQATGNAASKKLMIMIVLEVLLVGKNENRPGVPTGVNTESMLIDLVAARSGLAPIGLAVVGNRVSVSQATRSLNRRYADVAKRNIFVGAVPIEKTGPIVGKKKTTPEPQSPGNIPRYIRLVHTIPTQQEAYLLNLFYRNEELKLSANPKTGYQVRRISDDNGDYVFCFMKVLKVDSGVVYFQVKDDVFSIQLGQTLDDAISDDPYTTEELEAMGIVPDPNFAKQKGGTGNTKKKGSKGG